MTPTAESSARSSALQHCVFPVLHSEAGIDVAVVVAVVDTVVVTVFVVVVGVQPAAAKVTKTANAKKTEVKMRANMFEGNQGSIIRKIFEQPF